MRPVWMTERGLWVQGGAINVNQPEIHLSLCRVAAKLALAIFYNERKLPAGKKCRIDVNWAHSQEAGNFQNVQTLIQAMPNQTTLKMGKWNTEDSFFLRYFFENGQLSIVAVFHQAVALLARLREPNVSAQPIQSRYVMSPSPSAGIAVVNEFVG